MKKLYSLSLLLAMLFGLSFNAEAYNLKFEWDTPGALVIKTGNFSTGDVVFDGAANPTATSFEYSGEEHQMYVLPAEGFYITEGTCAAADRTFKPASYLGNGFSMFVTDNMYNQTVTVKCGKLERNDTFTFDVVNGADYFTAEFSNGLKLDLKNGKNEINFNPDIDQKLYIRFTNRDYMYMYSLEYNGTEMVEAGKKFDYTFNTVDPNSTITMQWFEEGKEPQLKDCTITFNVPAGMEDAVKSITDKSASKLYELKNLADNKITVKEGSTVLVNLNSVDYSDFSATLNNAAVSLNAEQDQFSFVVTEETNTFVLSCKERVYDPVPFTAYIMNPQGVTITVGNENSSSIALTGGTAISSDMTVTAGALDSSNLETFVFEKASTKEYSLEADGKKPLLWIRANNGYYIRTFIGYDSEGDLAQFSGGLHLNYTPDKTIYIMAIPMGTNSVNMEVKLEGGQPSDYRLIPSERATSWGNPTCNTKLTAADNTIKFEADLDNPFIIRGNGVTLNAVYVDAIEVPEIVDEGVETGRYLIEPYIPTSADDPGYSTVVAFSGSKTPVTSGVTLELIDGAEADFYVSTARRAAQVGDIAILSGTKFYVKPADPYAIITYKDVVVNGYDAATATMVEGLNERGEYEFTVSGNARANVLTVAPAAPGMGITSVAADSEGNFTVVGIDGRVVLRSSDPDALNSLDNGIYIVNGRKVAVKK